MKTFLALETKTDRKWKFCERFNGRFIL